MTETIEELRARLTWLTLAYERAMEERDAAIRERDDARAASVRDLESRRSSQAEVNELRRLLEELRDLQQKTSPPLRPAIP